MGRMQLFVGDRISVAGGYYEPPAWLQGLPAVAGRVLKWIPGQNTQPACVVALDEPIVTWDPKSQRVTGAIGAYLVLELRHCGREWDEEGVVHVEICEEEPESISFWDRRCGTWTESHASYRKIIGEHSG